ncbi:MAG: hypothetical protein WC450_08865 [Candidatus Omnitrophota bacterium]|jgi:hypothetical protein
MTSYPEKSKRWYPVRDDRRRIAKKALALIAVLILFLIVLSDGKLFPWANLAALGGLFWIEKVWG